MTFVGIRELKFSKLVSIIGKRVIDTPLFILSTLKHSKDWVTQLAYILRGILIDHIFEEGNKRTALAVMLVYFEANKKAYDIYKTEKIITEIILKNIKDINKIRRMIKNVIWQ